MSLTLLLTMPLAAGAVDVMSGSASLPPPISELENIEGSTTPIKKDDDDKGGMPFDMRRDAMKEAALSYGARGGLAWRTYHIRNELETRATQLDKTFDFRQLLIPAPSGLLIEPPIISEAVNALLIEGSGQEAAVSDRVYEIIRNAHIVSAPRSWRNYLERDWGEVLPPPDILRPSTKEEREEWIVWVREGWEKGLVQADEIFTDDLNQLSADYNGMVRYRLLLAQGMISPPNALQVDRGVTGTGNRMRVGDRAVQITGKPAFVSGAEKWQPANR
ncbi:MAG: type IV secretion system DotC family protein [Micavibrio aeruginosavorus]|uniref:Type IV secretion system DotC family protein n=1 Tax=Micavibrio aeruginosavorus TaxID=349221 RepID=A0A7T5UIC9_9BACT|nr:MAG: type IV secretion system DotC family protein [Micavibrio aeruginosavorus]